MTDDRSKITGSIDMDRLISGIEGTARKHGVDPSDLGEHLEILNVGTNDWALRPLTAVGVDVIQALKAARIPVH